MKSLPEGISLEELEWRVATDTILHLEGIPAFYYPELLEDQYIYLFRTTRLRWQIESDMKELPTDAPLVLELKKLLAAGDIFQANIAKHSHPKGHKGRGVKIPRLELMKLVEEYRRDMAEPIARIITKNKVFVHSEHFKATMLESENL